MEPVNGPGKRKYDASRRQAAAQETRRRMAAVARELFLRDGYAATRMADVAEAAGVSTETLYSAFGPKPRLVQFLIEVALSGEDRPVPSLEREWVKQVRAEPDPQVAVDLFAAGARALQERVAPIWMVTKEASKEDATLAEIVNGLQERRRRDMKVFVDGLAAKGRAQPELWPGWAADVVWGLNSPELYSLFVSELGWTPEQFESWFAASLKRLLLGGGEGTS